MGSMAAVRSLEKPSEKTATPAAANTVTDSRELAQLQNWRLLHQGADRPMHHHAWLRSCVDTFGGTSRRVFLTVGGDEPTALAPLIMRGERSQRLELPGVQELYEPTEFPHRDKAALSDLTDVIARTYLPLVLKRVQADSPLIQAL